MQNKNQKITSVLVALLVSTATLMGAVATTVQAATTTPGTIAYQGRLLDSSSDPLAGSYTFRFSIWSDADSDATDYLGSGAIDPAATGYEGWTEEHAVTTDAFGLFDVDLGSILTLPNFTAATHTYLQVDVKVTGAADTTYEVLDPDTSSAVIDRNVLHKKAYAENADTVDNADVGTAAGNLATLGTGGVWDIAVMGSGTNADTFIIDDNDDGATSGIQFGSDGTDGSITFTNATGDITITTPDDSDLVNIDNATLTSTSDAGLDFGTSDTFRIREASDPNTNAACTYVRELIMNTADGMLMRCTGVGVAGVATWTNIDTTGGSVDFEGLFANDADDTLTTSNSDFTINSGTGDTIITSNDWGVDASGNITTNGTVDGVDLQSIPFANLATRAKELVFSPEYPNFAVEQDGTANKGKMEVFFVDDGGAAKRNYYNFTTRNGSIQDMYVTLSFQLPLDFVSFTGAPLNVNYQTSDGVITTNQVDIELYDTTGTAVALTGGSDLANAAWTNAAITFGGGETFTAGSTVTMKLLLQSTSSGFARISDIVFNYNGR